MKITKISLNNFRAFRGECSIDLHEGRNLLLYGENGSGKSSIFQALDLFLAPNRTPIADHKNIFVMSEDGYVKLEIGDGTNPSDIYEWEETSHPSSESIILESSKTKGFLDYRALLHTHFVQRQADQVDVFDLLVNTLLANIQNPVTRIPFREEWQPIKQLATKRRSKSSEDRINKGLINFNAGLIRLLDDLTVKANDILNLFEHNTTMQLSLLGNGLVFNTNSREIENRYIYLTAEYYGRPITRHHHFLNEARLSAIGISIYLGALLLNPPSSLQVLFLDDVFIGLDMSNRLPLLDVLEQFFSDWQILSMTYDRVWFEMVKKRVEVWQPSWELAELFCKKSDECDIPVYHSSKDYLSVAQQHLDNNDLKAAAIYIRSAYERELKFFCDKHKLPVQYCENRKMQKSEHFWFVVKSQKTTDEADLLDSVLVNRIELYRSSILNPLSHTVPVNLVRHEVSEALQTVTNLKNTLRPVERGGLQL